MKLSTTIKNSKIWMGKNLFNSPVNSIISILLILLVGKGLLLFIDWFFIKSVLIGSAADCRASDGACLAFIKEKFRFIIFGLYPREEQFRPLIAMLIFITAIYYSRKPERWTGRLLKIWSFLGLFLFWLMKGGLILEVVDSSKWGGLPLTLILSFVGISFSYPIGIILALGRRSQMPLIKTICISYIELIRGVPLISLLFMSSVMFPLFMPEGITINKLLRAQVAIIMFSSAYMAEVVRGGLQGIEKGQYEAAEALGLSYYQTMRFIILPQALKLVIPPTVNTAIGMFKDTSLVLIIALFDLLSTGKTAIKDSDWLGFTIESYLFVALIYFIFCYAFSSYSRKLELILDRGYTNN